MMYLVTPKQMKFLESAADKSGNTYEILMENAGKKLTENMFKIYCSMQKKPEIIFLCGNGNNAGDCFVAARYLSGYGIRPVMAMLCGEPKTKLAKLNFKRMTDAEVLTEKDTIINRLSAEGEKLIADGVFGTGFHGELSDEIKEIFSAASANGTVVAVDVPSGGNCLDGSVSDGTMKASYTYTFAFEKFGMSQYPLKSYCGKIKTEDIGISEKFVSQLERRIIKTEKELAASLIPEKKPDAHKGNFGRLLIVCGSETMPGACIMSALAAGRTGVGLLQTASTEKVLSAISQMLPESMQLPLTADENGFISADNFEKIMKVSEKATAVLIGCGIGVDENTKKLVKKLIENLNCPVILDADGINCIADSIDIIKEKKSSIILTPHPAEMGRLCGKSAAQVQSDRLGTATEFSERYDAVTVLKGAGTIVSYGDTVYVNHTGNPGMGKGGSGDVLSGIIASLAAQGISPAEAAALGVFVHGIAGDLAAEEKTMQCMTATDIIAMLPKAFGMLTD